MDGKKWSISFISLYIAALLFIGGLVIITDPYFHYHAPMQGISYSLGNAFYINEGVSKNFNYNAMITGTSMTRNFRITEADELFNRNFVRITYLGEGFKRIGDNLKKAIKANPDLELVIWGLDPIWFITGKDWMGYEEYPDYLFDDVLWNDANYLYNKEILWNDVIPEIIRTIKKEPADQFDNYTANKAVGKKSFLENYQRPPKETKPVSEEETKEFFNLLEENLNQNILSVINNNPNVSFYVFIAPYSICWWDSLNQSGTDVLMRRIDMEQFVFEKLLPCNNVRLFSFFNNFDLICDLNNYEDDIHYAATVNSQILVWIKEGKYELTQENYMDYLKDIRDFYSKFDYDSIFASHGE